MEFEYNQKREWVMFDFGYGQPHITDSRFTLIPSMTYTEQGEPYHYFKIVFEERNLTNQKKRKR